ncbi:hypothetical protein ACTXM3_10180 [Glutamicibacter arilaitensis]|uniref:hypothetical protein n=1 Tax=Glutamicibacter arilaitensis TaxID=256701 RepID=UPI003F9E22A4
MRKHFWVDIPDGHRLGFSHEESGAFRAHIFDNENKLVGHANLFEVPEEAPAGQGLPKSDTDFYETRKQREYSEEEIAEMIQGLVFLSMIAIAAVEKISIELPRIQAWWKARILPSVKTILDTPRRITQRRQRQLAASEKPNLRRIFENYRNAPDDSATRDAFVNTIMSKEVLESATASARTGRSNPVIKNRQEIGSSSINHKSVSEQMSWLLRNNPDLVSDESIAMIRGLCSGMGLGSAPIRLEIDKP